MLRLPPGLALALVHHEKDAHDILADALLDIDETSLAERVRTRQGYPVTYMTGSGAGNDPYVVTVGWQQPPWVETPILGAFDPKLLKTAKCFYGDGHHFNSSRSGGYCQMLNWWEVVQPDDYLVVQTRPFTEPHVGTPVRGTTNNSTHTRWLELQRAATLRANSRPLTPETITIGFGSISYKHVPKMWLLSEFLRDNEEMLTRVRKLLHKAAEKEKERDR
jgi:hypothetical protein